MRPIVIDGKIFFDMYIDVRLSHLNKDYLLTYLLSVVCGSVSHVHKLHKKDKPVNLSFERADSNGPNEPCILDGGRDSPREGAILGVVRPIEKHWESVLRLRHFTQQKINNSDSGTAVAGCNAPD